jgi:L-fucose mutarotase
MLKNLDPLLGPDLLHVLASMGHGDELAVVDANFPAASFARRLVRVDGASATAVVRAVLSVMPLDTFVDAPLASMAVVGDAAAVPGAVREFDGIAFKAHGSEAKRDALERNAFYARAQSAYAIVQTGETRLYANLLLRKGVVAPGGAA